MGSGPVWCGMGVEVWRPGTRMAETAQLMTLCPPSSYATAFWVLS